MITNEQLANAHHDLECGIIDLAEMANVCRILIGKLATDFRKLDDWKVAASLVVAEIEPVEFCVNQLHQMAFRLKNEYYEPLDKAS